MTAQPAPSHVPSHTHNVTASEGDAIQQGPGGALVASGIGIGAFAVPGSMVSLNDSALSPSGGDQPHNNMQPYLTLYFCIALQGVYPPRT